MAGVKMEQAKQALVRYIREGAMRPGDRLPAQEELRRRLGFGSATIAAAIHELKGDNVIDVRDKIGVFVVNPDADGHAGRVIGLAVNALEVSAFRSCLANLLQIQLAERGWQVLPFFCMASNLNGKLDVAAFPGLRRMVEQGGIEALITLGDFSDESLDFFKSKHLPVLFVGSLETRTARVVIDMAAFLREALAKFHGAAIRRPAILISQALEEWLSPCFRGALADFPAASNADELIFAGNFVSDGKEAARRLLALPAKRRPDGVVIFDDTLASSFTAELYRVGKNAYHPRLAILRNLQNPMDFATDDPFYFAVDLKILAGMAAELLLKQFNGQSDDVLHYIPELIQY